MTVALEDLLRELAPQVLGALVRRYGHFDTAEDAVQEALLAAAQQWPDEGVPDSPRGWLITVASRRLTDLLRREQARQRREDRVAQWALPGEPVADTDDTLVLLFMCCHPSLSPASQIALTLRAVGGLTTAEIARAFLVPEATMTRRITRAKASVKDSGARFTLPTDRDERLGAVLEGRVPDLQRGLREYDGAEPATGRVGGRGDPAGADAASAAAGRQRGRRGLLALMLLTDARRPARTGPLGELVPMAEQDRSLWIPELIQEGVELITAALPRGPVGPYQLQAAIAAVHDEAPSAEETDWAQIVALYEVLLQLTDNPMVALNHVVAVAMARGPDEGLVLLASIEDDERIAKDHRLFAVRAHLLEMSGDAAGARAAYEQAASRTTSLPQQRYLHTRASRL